MTGLDQILVGFGFPLISRGWLVMDLLIAFAIAIAIANAAVETSPFPAIDTVDD